MPGRPPATRRACFWPQCDRVVPASRLGCRGHWYALPAQLRARIWEHYVPGQTAATASPEYIEALKDVLDWAVVRQAQKDAEAARLADMQRRQVPLF